jgi:hypothetical protein
MPPIRALRGEEGMQALVCAYTDARAEFDLAVTVATPIDGGAIGSLFVFTIGETSAALTFAETEWLADTLLHRSGGMGGLSANLEQFGRVIIDVLASVPGAHGAH